MQHVRNNLPNLLCTSTPVLTNIARYYFLHPLKQLRPLLVLLFANATNGLGSNWITKKSCVHSGLLDLDTPLSRPDVINDWNPLLPSHSAPFSQQFLLIPVTNTAPRSSPESSHLPPPLLPTQICLAQVVEMIHVASLLHDDVIDKSPLRHRHPSAPAVHGNKLSIMILAGNFVLSRASSALSRLGDSQVTKPIANVIVNLVEGELIHIQMDGAITYIHPTLPLPRRKLKRSRQDFGGFAYMVPVVEMGCCEFFQTIPHLSQLRRDIAEKALGRWKIPKKPGMSIDDGV